MIHPTKPGQKCRVLWGRSEANEGEGTSPNKGKIVTTMWRHEQLAGGTHVVWHVAGENIIGYYGTVGNEGDF